MAMKRSAAVSCLFVDIGGVLLSDGWDHLARRRAATQFKLDLADLEARHAMVFGAYESGKLRLADYLGTVVFHQRRAFTRAAFWRFMVAQSQPYPRMLSLVAELKARYGLKIVVVSNEGRELNAFRIRRFKLASFVDAFVSSCFVHVRKPDADIFTMALDIAQVPARRVVYLENTPMFVQAAQRLGIQGILHKDYASTRARLSELGLAMGLP